MQNLQQNGASINGATESASQEIRDAWKGWGETAARERYEMIGPFQEWLVKKRTATHLKMARYEEMVRENAPLTRLAIDVAESPHTVPLCVIEFAMIAAELEELRSDLAMLDVFYVEVAEHVSESLNFSDKSPRELLTLWNWYLHEEINSKEATA